MPKHSAVVDEAELATGTQRRGRFHSLRVSRVEPLCADAVAVSFDVPDRLAEVFAFRAGQALTLRREIDGAEHRRSYSICAPQNGVLRIGVRLVPDGMFSSWLVHEVGVGDEIDVLPPTGGFTPPLGLSQRHVCVAAGSGITPILSIVSSVLRETHGTVTLLYGNRRSDTVMFTDDLADLKDEFPARLELVHVLSREERDAELFTGRLNADKFCSILSTLVNSEDVDQWWLCGPYRMVRDAQQTLDGNGIARSRVHQELFFVDEVPPEPRRAAELPPDGAVSDVNIVMDGRTSTLPVPKDTPILDSAQRTRPDLPFACKGGVCGTCRAKIVDGVVHMRRNFALEQDEVDAGFVLTCQSLPVSDSVTADYDV